MFRDEPVYWVYELKAPNRPAYSVYCDYAELERYIAAYAERHDIRASEVAVTQTRKVRHPPLRLATS